MKKKIFIITGESSGDKLASEIVPYLNKKKYKILGIGSDELRKKKIKLLFNSSEISFMGMMDIFKNFLFLIKKINFTINSIIKFKPNVIFSIDAPDFSFRVESKIKKLLPKIKIIHLVAPTIWAWRESRAKFIKKFVDHMMILFPFEKIIFNKWKIKNTFVGHPFFVNKISYKKFKINKKYKIITFCPGSRNSEVKRFMPLFLKIIEKIERKYGLQYTYHFPVTKKFKIIVKRYINNKFSHIITTNDHKKNFYIKNSILSVAKSGTIALDICKNKSPLIIIFKISWLNYFLIKPLVKLKYGNIVNIAANKEIIPEFIQHNCTVNKIFHKISVLLENKNLRIKQVKKYEKIIKTFKIKNSNKLIANIIKSYC